MRSPCYLCIPRPINFFMPEPVFMTLGVYIIGSVPIKATYFINPSRQSVYLYVYPSLFARQRIGKVVTAGTNTQGTIEDILDASLYMRFVS
jgi:hypothetical protein